MPAPPNFRPALAALLLLAVLAGAYEGARWLPAAPAARRLAATDAGGQMLSVDDSLAESMSVDSDKLSAPLLAPATPPVPPTAAPEKVTPARPQPMRFTERSRPGPRRYVGTVNGQPATAELSPDETGRLQGRFYLWRSGQEYTLAQASRRHPKSLVLSTPYFPYSSRAGGRWQLSQGPGLRGTWLDSAGRQVGTFQLRENYQGGVRYATRNLKLTGGEVTSRYAADVPEVSRDFLYLLGPGGRPLQGRLCLPPLVERRKLLLADQRPDSHSGHELMMLLNDFYLFSYELQYFDSPFDDKGSSTFLTTRGLLDLTTGRPLSIYHQLRPGYERRLRGLLAIHLLDQPRASAYTIDLLNGWEWATDRGRRRLLAPLPPETTSDDADYWSTWTCALTAQGLEISNRNDGVIIPYAELRPLVRPGTPLARMLRARGMR